ncbi:hypothetical protein WDW37_14685 [Bdellovibrionota bacterium FG-1]
MTQKKQIQLKFIFKLLIPALTAAMSVIYLGCGAPFESGNPIGPVAKDIPKCLDGNEQFMPPCKTPSSTPSPPGGGGVINAADGGNAAGNGIIKNLDSANTLIDPSTKPIQLANGPQGQKATEGGAGAPKPLTQTLANVSAPDLTGRARNSAPNAGGGGSDSGQGFGFSGLKTSPAIDSELAGGGPAPAASGGAEAASAYKSGGGSGSAEGGNAGGPLGYGAGGAAGGAEGGSGNPTIEVGKDNRPLADSPTAGTSDPEDYFTRHGLKENLFKIVERKYRETTMHWVQVDLQKSPMPAPLQ